MQIFIRGLNGKTLTLAVTTFYKIGTIKKIIEDYTNIPWLEQRLIQSGKQLENDKTIADYDITDDATIHLVLRLKAD